MDVFYSKELMGDNILLTGEEHIHCSRAFRSKPGDQIFITDGRGAIYSTQILTISKNETNCLILSKEVKDIPVPKTTIAISTTKNTDRLEWFLEKSVEIGISEIFVYLSQRSTKKNFNAQRAERILISAMKQSLNFYLPTLLWIPEFNSLLDKSGTFEQKFIAHCSDPDMHLLNVFQNKKSTIVLIGPEGDFTISEIQTAESVGFISVSLGEARLRTETAGLAALLWMKAQQYKL